MTKEQINKISECILILRGAANLQELNAMKPDEILKEIEKEICDTMEVYWDLVDENKKLKYMLTEFLY